MFADYEKAFDSIEIWYVLNALINSRIDYRYATLIQNIYKKATFKIQMDTWTYQEVKNQRGVRQDDPLFPKL